MKLKRILFSLLLITAIASISKAQGNEPVMDCRVGNCNPASRNINQCEGFLNLMASASDDLTPADELLYAYTIDLYNNGGTDAEVSALSKKQFANGEKPTLKNLFAKDPNNPFDASGTYPLGVHKICWKVKDLDSNEGQCHEIFEIKDCKAPIPYCLTGIITVPLPSTGCIDIWTKDLDHGSFDNCTRPENLKFYFDGDTSKTSIRICCEDFVKAGANNELLIDVQVWVEDEEGNKDYCKTTLTILDLFDQCGDLPLGFKFEGSISSIKIEEMNMVVSLFKDSNFINITESVNREFVFKSLQPGKYSLKFHSGHNPLNGITTADIVKIKKHILHQEIITNPHLKLAADVNDSHTITTADISELRKLILGVNSSFSKVPNWVVVPTNLPIDLMTNKFKVFEFEIIDKDVNVDFIAIKMGDVNGSARACD